MLGLALGIGANVALFSVVDSVFLRPLAYYEPDQAHPEQSVATSPPTLTTEDLGAFFDDLVPQKLQRADIAGAVVAVVKDGRILFASAR